MTALRLRLHTRSALRLRVVPVYGAAVAVAAARDSSAAAAASAAAALAGANDAANSAAAAAASAAAVPRMRYGAGAPSSGLGVDGDFYIDTNTDTLHGPKASGAWPAGTSLVGPPGPQGPAGINGWVPSAADKYQYSTGAGLAVEGIITPAGRALLDDADAAAQRATLGIPAAATPWSHRNLIINGSCNINQRGVSGTVTLAAGDYGHDRWKAGAGGCTYTFTASGIDTLITITSGTLCQVVEDKNVEGGVYTASWSGTATARVWQGSPSASYAASGFQTSSLTANTHTTIEFSTGTLTRAQIEPGTVATAFERRPPGLELILCQRYLPAFSVAGRIAQGLFQSSTLSWVTVFFTTPTRVPVTGLIIGTVGNLVVGSDGLIATQALSSCAISGTPSVTAVRLACVSAPTGAPAYAAAQLDMTANTPFYFMGSEL
ncbi:hypothetical protein [Rhodoplanes serenus]|uniref:hypothetical protein n=1 Tax=Rhodoplanes serenus TaxID=200615 RepID=UPI0011B93746|nr:hypothetical protein [Rhodoplanes serenus]